MSEQPNLTTPLEERQKQIGIWTAGVFTAVSAAFMVISFYAAIVVQQGQFELEDVILMPTTVILTIGSLLSYFLIRQGRYKTGSELLFIAMMATPVMATLVLSNMLVIAIAFTVLFAPMMYNWVLLKTSRRLALVTIALMALAFIGIEVWNPSFRGISDVAVNVTPFVIGLAIVALLVTLGRQAWSGNIRIKIVTSFTMIALISVAIVGMVAYISYRNQVRNDIRQRLLNILTLVAINQDGDLHATIHGPEDADSDAHKKILTENVQYLATDTDLIYIYTMRKNEQGQIYFVINARQGGEPGDPIGTIYNEPSNLLADNFDTLSEPVVEPDLYTDVYGQVLASYAPFYRSDGTREGIIGVDIDAEKVLAQERAILSLILGTTLGTMLVVTLLGLWLGNVFSSPIINLSAIAKQITKGDLSARAKIETTDEVGELAADLNLMTAQLQETLQGLEQRVTDRTRNLELAAAVGREVSQVRDLNIMLTDAAELIRKQFNLYYVQVYLTNSNQTYLTLEAGTGNVGSELLGRNHQLPLNTSSINGRAAIEKKSVVISDTISSAAFKPNPLLPNTHSEIAVPLVIGEKVVGVLDMQSEQPGVLSEEVLPAFEALAGQLAVAIQNANLLEETNQARAQVEAQARRLVREGWQEHLDAIHKPEQLGFVFAQNKVAPLAETEEAQIPDEEKSISVPIAVTGEPLGSLVVEIEDETRREQTSELVGIVARQVAQQIENLRLLDTAERYRAEAEQATRRTIRESWKTYADTAGELGYVYDLKEVRAHNEDHPIEDVSVDLPLKVRDEQVGKLSVFGLKSDDQESIGLINDVAERLGAHIESLRQFDQTQSALAQSEKLFEASSQLAQATDLQKLVGTVVNAINIPVINRALLLTFNYNSNGDLDGMDVIANWWNGSGHEATVVGTHYTPEIVRLMPMFVSPVPIFFNDSFNDERVDATTMQLVKRLNLRAVAVLPLHSGAHQIGMLMLEAEEPYNFTQSEIRLYTALAPQIATVLENRRQFAKAQQQAERESKLNVISQKIQSATTVEAVLQIAARELGHALGAPMTVAQLSMKDKQ